MELSSFTPFARLVALVLKHPPPKKKKLKKKYICNALTFIFFTQ